MGRHADTLSDHDNTRSLVWFWAVRRMHDTSRLRNLLIIHPSLLVSLGILLGPLLRQTIDLTPILAHLPRPQVPPWMLHSDRDHRWVDVLGVLLRPLRLLAHSIFLGQVHSRVVSKSTCCLVSSQGLSYGYDRLTVCKRFANASVNIITDVCTAILPLPVLKRLNLPKRQKIVLMVVFGLGGMSRSDAAHSSHH